MAALSICYNSVIELPEEISNILTSVGLGSLSGRSSFSKDLPGNFLPNNVVNDFMILTMILLMVFSRKYLS